MRQTAIGDLSMCHRPLSVILKQWLIVGLLSLMISAITLLVGCDSGSEDPQVYYGPPPYDADADPDAGALDQSADVPMDVVNDIPVVYYGPPADTGTDDQVIDQVTDVPLDTAEDGPMVLYGPQVDTVVEDQRVDAIPDTPLDAEEEIMILYGPQPADVGVDIDEGVTDTEGDCEMMVVYGPPPCDSNEFCVSEYGEGWYCNFDNTYDDGCGGAISWPLCEPE